MARRDRWARQRSRWMEWCRSVHIMSMATETPFRQFTSICCISSQSSQESYHQSKGPQGCYHLSWAEKCGHFELCLCWSQSSTCCCVPKSVQVVPHSTGWLGAVLIATRVAILWCAFSSANGGWFTDTRESIITLRICRPPCAFILFSLFVLDSPWWGRNASSRGVYEDLKALAFLTWAVFRT